MQAMQEASNLLTIASRRKHLIVKALRVTSFVLVLTLTCSSSNQPALTPRD